MEKQTLKDREELTYKKRFEDLQDKLKSPLDEIMEGRLVLEYEKKDKVKKLEKEILELRKFKDNFGKGDFEKSINVLLKMFKEIARTNNKLVSTEKNYFRLLKENMKLKKFIRNISKKWTFFEDDLPQFEKGDVFIAKNDWKKISNDALLGADE